MPLVPEGLDLFNASINARKFSFSASSANEARPMVHCTMPDLSARYWTWPAFAFLTASATFGVTMPTLMATSTDSLNLALAPSFTSLIASAIGYALLRSIFARNSLVLLEICAISEPLHFHAHAACAAGHGTHRRLQIRSGQIGHLLLGDLLDLCAGKPADLVGIRFGTALFDLCRLADQHRGRRGLDDEGETLVRVGGDHHRQRQTRLHALSLGVEGLAELHDVEAALAQCRPDRRARIGLACRNLQLDETDDFLCHGETPLESGC